MKSLLLLLLNLGIPFAAASQTLEVHNSSGLRMSLDTDDGNPALIIEVPDGPEGQQNSKILFPEHVTVRAHGHSEPEHLYMFRPGTKGYSPEWKKTDNALEYARDFGQIHFVARAILKDDGIVFHYEFTNPKACFCRVSVFDLSREGRPKRERFVPARGRSLLWYYEIDVE